MRAGESERLMIAILAAMNEKLDRILSIIDLSDPIALRFKEPQSINISGAGRSWSRKSASLWRRFSSLNSFSPSFSPDDQSDWESEQG